MAVQPSDVDRLGALPDALLQHVLSFVPSDEAVRSCVLSHRWRHLWRSTPALRVTDADGRWGGLEDMGEFVNHLLLLRDGRTPLDVCDIEMDSGLHEDDDQETRMRSFRYVQLWIRYTLTHEARVLRVFVHTAEYHLDLGSTRLASQHLTVLELEGVDLGDCDLDFSGCPALKTLEMTNCIILASKISSQSLQYLIANDNIFGDSLRTRISAPSLVSLQLNGLLGWTPVLDSMPLLVTASVNLDGDGECDDRCLMGSSGNCGDHHCIGCSYCPDGSDTCVLLRGLSNATNLELLAAPDVFIFRRDLVFCPKFSKLKTLVVSEWSVDVGMHSSLVCILHNSPVLEKLTFQLSLVSRDFLEMEESQNPTEQRYAFEHLKVVEVKCRRVDDRVQKLLKYLSFYGIHVDVKYL